MKLKQKIDYKKEIKTLGNNLNILIGLLNQGFTEETFFRIHDNLESLRVASESNNNFSKIAKFEYFLKHEEFITKLSDISTGEKKKKYCNLNYYKFTEKYPEYLIFTNQ